jgi:hypothetical protein
MKKIVKLTESDLVKLIGKVISEQPVTSRENIPGTSAMQQLRQTQRDDRRALRKINRASRRDVRAERAAANDLTALRNELAPLISNLNAFSKHQNTETYKFFLEMLNGTLASIRQLITSIDENAFNVTKQETEEPTDEEQ